MARVIKFLNPKSDEISKLIFHDDICVVCLICGIRDALYKRIEVGEKEMSLSG